ncbi:Hypothetical predicted protein [Mytilus galloprovincialis]|uniref:Uncharacterized protein n=1 Tax=Mytilus galloprovincialis TaxID=29158 RepID=A0A8B6H5T9_MYTGA|nr:Hypothetical predicted protein [Mytilus galloprovincialis]
MQAGGILLLIIFYLEEKHSYLVSKNISICTESQGACEQDYMILENTMLPVMQCSGNGGFVREDFSLERWRNESGISKNDSLRSVDVSELFEYIGLSYYLLSDRCNRSIDPYIPATKGWNSCTKLKHGLVGILRTETVVYNLAAENSYMILLTISVCLEANGNCIVTQIILDGLKIGKEVCDRSNDNEFSLAAWLDEKNIPRSTDRLPVWAEVQIKQDLRIHQFLKSESCNHTVSSNNGCGLSNIKVIPVGREDSLSCIVSTDCTSVECCVNLPILNTSVVIVFEINQCRNNLKMKIDNLTQNLKLSEVFYGESSSFGLNGIVKRK